MNLFESIQSNLKLSDCEKAYTEYVDTHISNVRKAWDEEVSKIDDDFIQSHLDEISSLISQHDQSKFDESEFNAYRANYNPVSDQEKIDNEANFQSAWYHHFQNNPHHWQHWLNEKGELEPLTNEDLVKMYYIEMICDWQAMGYVFGDTAKQYYDQNKDTIKIYPELQEWFENILNQLENKTITESDSSVYDENGVHLEFPFYCIEVWSNNYFNRDILEGFFTRWYRHNDEVYPGFASPVSSNRVDTALNYIKTYRTEKAAIKGADNMYNTNWSYDYKVRYVENINDLKVSKGGN